MEKKGSKKSKKGGSSKQEEKKEESSGMKSIALKSGKIFITINAKPGSKTDSIYAVEDDYIGVSVQAPPKEGQANEGIKEYIAEVLGIKKRDVSLVKGDKSSDKVISLDEPGDLTVEKVKEILKSAME